MEDIKKVALFEEMPVPKAVMTLAMGVSLHGRKTAYLYCN